jgi:hypothetical protein
VTTRSGWVACCSSDRVIQSSGMLPENEVIAAATSDRSSSEISMPPDEVVVPCENKKGFITGWARPPGKTGLADRANAADTSGLFIMNTPGATNGAWKPRPAWTPAVCGFTDSLQL